MARRGRSPTAPAPPPTPGGSEAGERSVAGERLGHSVIFVPPCLSSMHSSSTFLPHFLFPDLLEYVGSCSSVLVSRPVTFLRPFLPPFLVLDFLEYVGSEGESSLRSRSPHPPLLRAPRRVGGREGEVAQGIAGDWEAGPSVRAFFAVLAQPSTSLRSFGGLPHNTTLPPPSALCRSGCFSCACRGRFQLWQWISAPGAARSSSPA